MFTIVNIKLISSSHQAYMIHICEVA